jgi:NAD(P)H-hydrate repair Nnr-like enzyme with NAD(P)H-hydrate dehydratase domain
MHGQAGDIAAEKKGMDGMIAGDFINYIPESWRTIRY